MSSIRAIHCLRLTSGLLSASLCLLVGAGCPYKADEQMGKPIVEQYDPATDTWSRSVDMPFPLVGHASCATGGRIYVSGGVRRKPGLNKTLLRFDPALGMWEELQTMTTARNLHEMVSVGTDIYLVGGIRAGGIGKDSVDVFDTITETWSVGPPMLTPRYYFGAAELGGFVYVVGGRHNSRGLAQSEFLDPNLGLWQPIAPMPSASHNPAVETDGTLLYALGAFDWPTTTYEARIYDPAMDTWGSGPPMPLEVAGISAVIGNEIFLVDQASRGDPRSMLSFDTVAQTWTIRSPKMAKLFGASATAAGGLLYVIGGQTN